MKKISYSLLILLFVELIMIAGCTDTAKPPQPTTTSYQQFTSLPLTTNTIVELPTTIAVERNPTRSSEQGTLTITISPGKNPLIARGTVVLDDEDIGLISSNQPSTFRLDTGIHTLKIRYEDGTTSETRSIDIQFAKTIYQTFDSPDSPTLNKGNPYDKTTQNFNGILVGVSGQTQLPDSCVVKADIYVENTRKITAHPTITVLALGTGGPVTEKFTVALAPGESITRTIIMIAGDETRHAVGAHSYVRDISASAVG